MKLNFFSVKAFFLFGVMGQILLAGSAKAESIFADVSESHPNFTAIVEFQKLGVIQGYPDGTFQPDRPVNRAEALKIILLGSGYKLSIIQGTAGFTDIKVDDWYTKYIVNAAQLQIVQGYSDHTFRPEKTVNLVENLKMLLLAQKVDIGSVAVTQNPYADAFAGQWYTPYVQYAKIKNLIDADSQNKIYPPQGMTRGKLVETLYRIFYIQKNGLSAYPSVTVSTPYPIPQTHDAVYFIIDPALNRHSISPYIYGNNEVASFDNEVREQNQKLLRLGGNRWTGYNWENNASNAGTDWQNSSDNYLSNSDTPGDAIRTRVDKAFVIGAAALVTVPIVDYVAADKNGTVDTVASANNIRWNKNFPNSSGLIPANPDMGDRAVYQDQFINFLQNSYQDQLMKGRKIFYSLDNEPALWPFTHPLIHPEKNNLCRDGKKNC